MKVKKASLDGMCVDGLVLFVFRRPRYKHVDMIRLSQVYVEVAGCLELRLHSNDQTACTAHSCSRHGVVAAALTSERPGSPSPIATTTVTVLRIHQ